MRFLLTLLVALLGAGVGSFLNVAAVRLHERRSLGGRSKCDACGRTLGALELVPVFGYVFLGGRCHACHARIPWFHPVTEAAAALLFALAFWTRATHPLFVTWPIILAVVRDLAAVSFLVLLALTDLLYGELPDRFTWPAIGVLAILAALAGRPPLDVLLGAVAGAAFFLIQRVLSRGAWVGDGDAFLGAAIGALLGVCGGLTAILLAYVYGAVAAVVLLAAHKANRKTALPFAPFLSAAALTVLFFGPALWNAYLGLMMR